MDDARFTFGAFLRDRAASIAIMLACAASLFFMLKALGVSTQGAVAMCAFVLFSASFCGLVSYFRRRAFYKRTEDVAANLERASLFPEMLDEPNFLEGRLLADAIGCMGRLAGDEAAADKASIENYRDYIELWIHEIKTPLSAAALISQRIGGADADKLRRELARIERQVAQALFYARAASAANDYVLARVELADLVREAIKKNKLVLIERGCAPRVEIADEVKVIADAQWVVFMIGQIIGNSAKYGAREIAFSAHVEGAGTPREHTVLDIRDDGQGIPEKDAARVFDRAFVGENGRAAGSSTGMGLYLVAKMCEALGMGVALSSEQGRGTCVSLEFPHLNTLAG